MKSSPFDKTADHNFLYENGFSFTENPQECHIFLACQMESLVSVAKMFGSQKKYLLWTHEPHNDTNFEDKVNLENVDVHVMNVYTGNIYVNNYKYCEFPQLELVNYHNFSRPKGKSIVILARNKRLRPVFNKGQNIDLTHIRNEIAFAGYGLGKIEVYGSNWPDNIAIEDSIRVAKQIGCSWIDRKLELLKQYHFNLCFENTNYPYYCTEKIWQAIQSGCLPIYWGKSNAIYKDFPPNSFLDYSNFDSPSVLFDYVEKMHIHEFNDRLNLCIDTANRITANNGYLEASSQEKNNIINKLKLIIDKQVLVDNVSSLKPEIYEPGGTNLALNKPAKQSSLSRWSRGNDPQRAVNSVKNGMYSFCTSREMKPWWEVDLESVYELREIRVFNRLDNYSERACTLRIFISSNDRDWEEIYVYSKKEPFGGIDGKPLIAKFSSLPVARYVRLQLNEINYLHLDEVEVYGSLKN